MRAFALLLVLACVAPAHADEGFAITAYDQAEALRKAGKWEEACHLYRASYKADPQLGVLLHLADCDEHVGRIASAWLEFSDAIDLAKQKKDKREALARKRADQLVGRIARLRLVRPATTPPGMVIKRATVDITLLTSGDLPIDPGEHELSVVAPGYLEWKTKVVVPNRPEVIEVRVPELSAVPAPLPVADPTTPTPPAPSPVAPPKSDEGMLKITAQPNASILLDGDFKGLGRFEGKVKRGSYLLQIVAPGMALFQQEISIEADQERVLAPVLVAQAVLAAPDLRRFEIGVSVAPGVKLRGDRPNVISYRGEMTFRIGPRVSVGVYTELGSIDASDACGFDFAGPATQGPYDYGERFQLTKCMYVKPGLQVVVHPLPNRRLDPYVGVLPGVRFGVTRYRSYMAGVPGDEVRETFMGYVVGARIGLDVRPHTRVPAWTVGPFAELEVTAWGQEACDNCNAERTTYNSIFGGVRTGLAF